MPYSRLSVVTKLFRPSLTALALIGSLLIPFSSPAAETNNGHADNLGLRIEAGTDINKQIGRYLRVGIDKPTDWLSFQAGSWHFDGGLEAQLGYYKIVKKKADDKNTLALRLALVEKIHHRSWEQLFISFGTGPVYLFADTSFSDRTSTHLQFGTHLGLGWRGERLEYELRVEHNSNADRDIPNMGIDLLLFTLRLPLGN